MYQVEYGSFPQAMTIDGNGNYCPTPADTKYCIKPSSGNTFTYSSPTSPYQSFILDAIDTISTIKYRVTNDSAPVSAMPLDTVTIGTQTWMKYNLDVGTMITGTTAQTNNSILEKYCYNNDPANCTIYGGLYQWGETVQYQDGATNTTSPSPAFTGNIQGIAPAGFHIPTDVEWKTLEMYLGMTQAQADALWSRGTTEGDQLKNTGYCLGRTPCGTSGFNGLLGGNIYFERTSWQNMGETTNFWSSSDGVWNAAWRRYLYLGSPVYSQVNRGTDRKIGAFSIRCLKN
jgi:uncharacterized protein (TIGR02145 family)